MKLSFRHLSFALLGVVSAFSGSLVSTAKAQGVNWAAANWQAGLLSQNIAVGGNNALFAFTGDTGQFQPAIAGVPTPAVGSYGATASGTTVSPTYADGGTGLPALQLFMNYTANTQSVTLTVTFDTPVPAIGFYLFDVDLGAAGTTTGGITSYSFIDQISNVKASVDGTNYTLAPALTASSGTITGNNTTTNSVYGAITSNQNVGTSNVGVNFSNPAGIKSFQFTYGDHTTGGTTTAQADPSQEIIGMGNIMVPEPGTVACSAAGLLAIGLAAHGRRTIFARRS